MPSNFSSTSRLKQGVHVFTYSHPLVSSPPLLPIRHHLGSRAYYYLLLLTSILSPYYFFLFPFLYAFCL